MTKPSVGFIGMGLMGLPMTLRMLGAGYPVSVWNRSAEKTAPAVDAGAVLAASPADVAARSQVVMACLTDAKAVEAVLFGEAGVSTVEGASAFVDFSSMNPNLVKEFATRLEAANGMAFVDAPVSGSTPAAKAGTLTIMAGAADETFDAVRPLLGPLSSRVTHMGPVGSGQMTKMVNQIIAGSTMAMVAEAVLFAKRHGVDTGRLTDALAGGLADSKVFQLLVPRMAAEDFSDPLGNVATLQKDLDTVAAVAGSTAALPMLQTARDLLAEASRQGLGETDVASIILPLKDRS